MRTRFIVISCFLLLITFSIGSVFSLAYWALLLIVPYILLGVYDMQQRQHTLWRNFPVFGHGRWVMEAIRPMVQQYFVESDIDGAPISRVFRSVVYQRAKQEMDTVPYGTKFDVYREGYEWMAHSLAAKDLHHVNSDLRVCIGGKDCQQHYHASLLNISAMSFGALSSHAVKALNGGAKLGNFLHNTGEGGISDHHLKYGGDLVWQIGTGYFGCRTPEGQFDADLFADKATLDVVKMIEIKLSQGAKPGHGGILPACKNSPEIAAIRGVEAYTLVASPATHSAFSSPMELMHFIAQLRVLSGGKPVGIKLCIGQPSEFMALCKAMLASDIMPDFITVDGSEGGTGAGPLEYSNSIGMPLMDALAFVDDCLTGFALRQQIKIIASGKVFSGFHVVKRLSLGADLCNSARGMMLAMGCIQSMQCNADTCPTGITTQNPDLVRGLDISDKRQRVANFHAGTLQSVAEIVAAAGLEHAGQLDRRHIFRRVSQSSIKRYQDIYPTVQPGCLLAGDVPERFEEDMAVAHADCFDPIVCDAKD